MEVLFLSFLIAVKHNFHMCFVIYTRHILVLLIIEVAVDQVIVGWRYIEYKTAQ